MPEAIKTFRYTAQRSSYVNLIIIIIFLCIVEGGLTELLVIVLVHILWLKLVVEIGTIVSYIYICLLMLFPSWTKHDLTATQLHLHYGLSLNVYIPLASIATVQLLQKSPSIVQPISARYEAKLQRIVACFSDQGLVLLTLKQPLDLKVGWKRRTITNILLNVDQRDTFLATLPTF